MFSQRLLKICYHAFYLLVVAAKSSSEHIGNIFSDYYHGTPQRDVLHISQLCFACSKLSSQGMSLPTSTFLSFSFHNTRSSSGSLSAFFVKLYFSHHLLRRSLSFIDFINLPEGKCHFDTYFSFFFLFFFLSFPFYFHLFLLKNFLVIYVLSIFLSIIPSKLTSGFVLFRSFSLTTPFTFVSSFFVASFTFFLTFYTYVFHSIF
ncbi:unnamed protein product [Acanthosepion pharaonis]|uniref:Uncharacterized protein n=1 Tax=Acanthosepion pharaonis TaxID=158019 RepID=A0A812B5N5_ACAPH|nr:unnamed protein product [Sepia pharaonis]